MTRIGMMAQGAALRENNSAQQKPAKVLNLMGCQIEGLDFAQISSARLSVKSPLKHGIKNINGPYGKINLKISKNTNANLEIKLAKNQDGKLKVKQFKLSFSHHIIVDNPSSSLRENKSSIALSAVQDHLSSVKIKELIINEQGECSVNGKIRILKIINQKVPQFKNKINFPDLEQCFMSALGLQKAQETALDKISVGKLLQDLGGLLDTSFFDLNIEGEEREISVVKEGHNAHGKPSSFSLHGQGLLSINQQGDLALLLDKNKTKIKSSLGCFELGAKLSLRPQADNLRIALDTAIEGEANVFVDGFIFEKHPLSFASQKSSEFLGGTQKKAAPYKLSAEKIGIKASLHAHGDWGKNGKNLQGDAQAKIAIKNPSAGIYDRGITLDGQTDIELYAQNLCASNKAGLAGSVFKAELAFTPDAKVKESLPDLDSISLSYGLKLYENGQAKIKNPDYGPLRFLSPIKNFEAHFENLDTELSGEKIHPIGSKQYFEQIAAISNAKVSKALKAKLLINGIKSMPERLRLIQEAKYSIYFQALTFKDDESGWIYAKALVDAKKRGLKVCGIVDSIGNIESFSQLKTNNKIYEYLRGNGVELKIYNDFFEFSFRKIFQVSKKYRDIFGELKIKKIHNAVLLLEFLQKIVDEIENEKSVLKPQDKFELTEAIHILLNGNQEVDNQKTLEDLKLFLKSPVLHLEQLVLAAKRMGDLSFRAHEKFLIVDGKDAILGGMNIADEYLKGGSDELIKIKNKWQEPWQDVDILVSGEPVKESFKSFRRNWLHLAQEKLKFSDSRSTSEKVATKALGPDMVIIHHRPFEERDHRILNYFLYNLRTLKAGEKAWFETAYFLPRGALRVLQAEMCKAALRGVDVRIITNSLSSSDVKPVVDAAIFDYRVLLKAGVRIFAMKNARMLHAKVSVLGSRLCTVGSWNMDNRSASHDSEDLCGIYDEEIRAEMEEKLKADMRENADEVVLSRIKHKPLKDELRSAAMLWLGELL